MSALQYVSVPGYAALLLRRTYSDLSLPGALMDRAFQWLDGTDAHWSEQNKVWTFPSGATITFGYLETDKDKYRYQSSEFQLIGYDELTQFLEAHYTYLFSRLRRLKSSPVPVRMRDATNPGGVGNDWVLNRFPITKPAEPDGPIFVPAKARDNPHIDQDSYIKTLGNLDYVTREQLLNGRWDVSISGGVFSADPTTIPYNKVIVEPLLKDNGYHVYGACDPSEGGKDFASIATVVELPDHRWLTYDCDMSVDIQSATIDKIINLHSLYGYEKFWIEANSLGHAKSAQGESLFESELKKRQADRGEYVPYSFVWNTNKKTDRIRALEPFYSNGQLIFFEDHAARYPILLNQLKTFPTSQHDDGPDALATCIAGIIGQRKASEVFVLPAADLPGISKWQSGQSQGGYPWSNRSLTNPSHDEDYLHSLGIGARNAAFGNR